MDDMNNPGLQSENDISQEQSADSYNIGVNNNANPMAGYNSQPQNEGQMGYGYGDQYQQAYNRNILIDGETPEQKAEADKLCKISLICFVGSRAVYMISSMFTGMFSSIFGGMDSIGSLAASYKVIAGLVAMLSMGSTIAAYVTMVMARVKSPKNKFAKVLMWVYIGLFVAGLIVAILAIVMIVALCNALLSQPGCANLS